MFFIGTTQSPKPQVFADGILVLSHRPTLRRDAATVHEHIEAFNRHSRFRVWSVNTAYGYPPGLDRLRFSIIILHYSLFGGWFYYLNKRFYEYIDASAASYKIAFFQDEYRYCQKRFGFLDRYKVNCVYTLLQPKYFDDTYRKNTRVPKLISHLPGYVSEPLSEAASRFAKSDQDRAIDIGYRGRKLEYYMGKGAQEKYDIAIGFQRRLAGSKLTLDIECDEGKRLYGDDWYRFMGNCRGILGVEAGVSIFDVKDIVRVQCDELLTANPGMSFQEISERVLYQWEERIPYRTISPRHFEAAAFHACQILFEGNYSGILRPMVHYIPVKKDFSNFDEVIRLFDTRGLRQDLTAQAHRDLIASGRYSYGQFIAGFDAELEKEGLRPGPARTDTRVTSMLEDGMLYRKARAIAFELRLQAYLPAWLRKLAKPAAKPLFEPDTHFDVESH